MLGTFALSSGYYGKYYLKAQAARQNVRADFARLFSEVDLIAGPTMPTVAFRLGEKDRSPLLLSCRYPDRSGKSGRNTGDIDPLW
jgi:aspartyl/glutamyl-tRNA(Asn/Gln) amidotransferase subunit A (EC 6.3.5.-)